MIKNLTFEESLNEEVNNGIHSFRKIYGSIKGLDIKFILDTIVLKEEYKEVVPFFKPLIETKNIAPEQHAGMISFISSTLDKHGLINE